LGIFYRLFTLFEEACHELDLAAHVSVDVAGATYGRYASALRQQSKHNIPDGVDRLRNIMKEHLRHTAPSMVALQPAPKKLRRELLHVRDMEAYIYRFPCYNLVENFLG
jgi:hypothetical protein